MTTKARATIQDLYDLPDNAPGEIVDGEVVLMSPTGGEPGYAGDEIFVSLREFARLTSTGRAVGDNKAFRVHLKNRESFSPDAAFYVGPNPGMKFYEGPPIFAVEVRSENDYGSRADERIARKLADYFAAGTIVVWDVDLLSPDVIKCYPADNATQPMIFSRGKIAHAQPALPGWSFPVDSLFEKD